MQTLLIAVAAGVAFIIAYHTYGRWLGSKIFQLSAKHVCPSTRLRDGHDYVPTPKAIVFGHHFTSIAGTGPIVGPAIAVMWGWLPALLWVVFGSIFIGAVHDFGSLVVSLRNNGQTVGDIAGRVLNKRVRLLFLFVLFLALTIVLAIFGLVIAAVFKQYPAAIFPCMVQIPLAIAIGLWLHRKGVNLTIPSILALAIMYLTVVFGDENTPIDIAWLVWIEHALHVFNSTLADCPIIVWVMVLLVYSYIASVLPVWTLLQPRDYINSLQLLTALALVVVGLCAAAFIGGSPPVEGAERQPLEIVAPMVNWDPAGAPLIFPFLFITIACGAISGFHCLVSSGTSSKQLEHEPEARFVGYGAMLTEGFLATIVILACVAGLGLGIAGGGNAPSLDTAYQANGLLQSADGSEIAWTGAAAWESRYSSWSAAGGLARTVGAFVDGSANFLKAIGIPAGVAVALMGVLVASFAGTTLDTACRLQRYVVQELAGTLRVPGQDQGGVAARLCPVCDYDLRRNLSGKCPECGWEIDPSIYKAADGIRGLPGPPMPSAAFYHPLRWLENKHGATLFAVVVAALVAATPVGGAAWSWANAGKGGMILWPMFGATNQLLGGLAFMVIAFWLWRRGKPVWFVVLPAIFMLIMPAWALWWQMFIGSEDFPAWFKADDPNWMLIVIGVATGLLEIWMIIEAVLLWPKAKDVLEPQLPGNAPAVETVEG